MLNSVVNSGQHFFNKINTDNFFIYFKTLTRMRNLILASFRAHEGHKHNKKKMQFTAAKYIYICKLLETNDTFRPLKKQTVISILAE